MTLNVFIIIQLLFKILTMGEDLLAYIEANKGKELEERRQAREKAIEDLKNATSESDFDKAQGDIVRNRP